MRVKFLSAIFLFPVFQDSQIFIETTVHNKIIAALDLISLEKCTCTISLPPEKRVHTFGTCDKILVKRSHLSNSVRPTCWMDVFFKKYKNTQKVL